MRCRLRSSHVFILARVLNTLVIHMTHPPSRRPYCREKLALRATSATRRAKRTTIVKHKHATQQFELSTDRTLTLCPLGTKPVLPVRIAVMASICEIAVLAKFHAAFFFLAPFDFTKESGFVALPLLTGFFEAAKLASSCAMKSEGAAAALVSKTL
jgi:hypothetical protein